MNHFTRISFYVFIVVTLTSLLSAQQSDFQVKKNFETEYNAIKGGIDSSKSTGELDTLAERIKALERQFVNRKNFLDKALYPETFDSKMENLKTLHVLTYDRVYLIANQGVKIEELEGRILLLTTRLDTLGAERNRLFDELRASKKTVATLQAAIKKLSANLQAKDRLLFALIDSIFLPYDKNLNQVADVQKEAISRKLQKSSILTRIYDIAADNVEFLGVTQLQGKDYASMIDQYQQFNNKWTGLSEKINAVHVASEVKTDNQPKTGGATSGKKAATVNEEQPPSVHVDSVVTLWYTKLTASFWSQIAKEFSSKGIALRPFSTGTSFSASIHAYVDSMKASESDASIFVNDVWKERIDKDWRDALTKETMLGKAEYASLDKAVSELGQRKFDATFIGYIIAVLVIVLLAWWFLKRKPKPASASPTK